MKGLQKVSKYAAKVYKNAPKKKLVKKAAIIGFKQILGGTYLDLASFFVSKSKKKIIKYAGSYAYDSFLRSKFAREKLNSLPMILVSTILRTITNFLIFSRIQTNLEWLDFLISIFITIIVTLTTPIFYKSISAHEKTFLYYTNILLDKFMGPGGWILMYRVKTVLVLSIGLILLSILQFVDVNSGYLQKIIIHTLITGFITEQIEQYINNINHVRVLYYGMGPIHHVEHHIIPISVKYKTSNICDTKNIVLIGLNPLKAKIVSDLVKTNISKVKKTYISKPNIPKVKKTYMVNIMDDYVKT